MSIGRASVNKVTLLGNVGQDPELKQTSEGIAVTTLSLATNEVWKDHDGNKQEKTEWHRVVMWRKQAEIACEYLKKGSKIYLEGKLQTRFWQDKDGVKRSVTEVIADTFTMLDNKQAQVAQPAPPEMDAPPQPETKMAGQKSEE